MYVFYKVFIWVILSIFFLNLSNKSLCELNKYQKSVRKVSLTARVQHLMSIWAFSYKFLTLYGVNVPHPYVERLVTTITTRYEAYLCEIHSIHCIWKVIHWNCYKDHCLSNKSE